MSVTEPPVSAAEALLADGTAVLVRVVEAGDRAAVLDLHEHGMSEESRRMRFLGTSRRAAGMVADRLCGPGRAKVLALGACQEDADRPLRALLDGPGRRHLPVAAVLLDQEVPVQYRTCADGGQLPSYSDPAAAARALAHARYGAGWLAEPPSAPVAPPAADTAGARRRVDAFLAAHPGGGWLDPRCTRVPRAPSASASAARPGHGSATGTSAPASASGRPAWCSSPWPHPAAPLLLGRAGPAPRQPIRTRSTARANHSRAAVSSWRRLP
ncbi:hypothetical protein [Kitasatospora sp. NPDC085879]|uniref:hypothetical protein n=1 Tax=Kitasatospora sp. NPDC085879 TaxID=3154769 RepID=UPI00343AF832